MATGLRGNERSPLWLFRHLKHQYRLQKRKLIQALRYWTQPIHPTGVVSRGVADVTRSRSELILENMLLRQQLIVLQRQVKRPKPKWRERITLVLLARWVGERWQAAVMLVQPETILRWHREMYRMIWRRTSKAKGSGGRPRLSLEMVRLIHQMALENHRWGAERIHGELLKLGMRVAKSTIQKYLWRVREGLPRSQGWKTFLHNHGSQIWACDFLQTYDVFFRAIFVYVIIELGSRRVVHFNVTRSPGDDWVAQQMREATPFGEGPQFLIKDNDDKYGERFVRVARGVGIEVIPTPIAAPKANAHCERFIGTLRRECLDHMIILSERHLHRIVGEYTTFYNECRPHQGIDQRIPCASDRAEGEAGTGEIISVPVLGGLHHDYRQRAA